MQIAAALRGVVQKEMKFTQMTLTTAPDGTKIFSMLSILITGDLDERGSVPLNCSSDESNYLFRRLTCAHRQAVQAELTREGLPGIGQPRILCILARQGDAGEISTQRELAQRLHVSAATVTTSLKSLERQGYVRTIPDEADGRRKRVAITDKGREAVGRCFEVFSRVNRQMYEGFSPEELELLQQFHNRMADNLQPLLQSGTEEGGEVK